MSILGLTLWACSGQEPDPDLVAADTGSRPGSTAVRPIPDADGDTWTVAQGDCDDTDPSVHPYADDPCDGRDTDCDGDLEPDGDGDGYRSCEECDDAAAETWPGAPDPLDGVDNDCDGTDGVGVVSDSSLLGTVACGEFGWSIGAIDVDADGTDEVVVGAPRYQGCGGLGWDQVVLSTTEIILDYVEGNSILKGWHVDPFNIGTAPMVAVMNGGYPPGGAVEVYTLTGATFGGTPVLFVEGTPARSTGDIQAVGAPVQWLAISTLASYMTETTSVRLFPPDATGVLGVSDAVVVIDSDNLHPASGLLEDVGDRDGDGLHELAVSAPYGDGTDPIGRAYVVTPGLDARMEDNEIWIGDNAGDYTGSTNRGGDVDGDGTAEVLIGSHHADDDFGRVDLVPFLGPGTHLLTEERIAVVLGEFEDDYLRASTLADANGDGFGDLVVGAQQDRYDAYTPGKAMLFLGPVQGTLTRADADKVWLGDQPGSRFGWDLASGDFDGNGVLDLAVTAPDQDSITDVDVGAVHFIYDYGL